MRSLTKSLVSFLKKEDGPTAVEYAVMLALIIVVCIAAITTLGSNANETFSFVGSSIKVRQAERRPGSGRPRSRCGPSRWARLASLMAASTAPRARLLTHSDPRR